MKQIKLILATSSNGIIGNTASKSGLPWKHLPRGDAALYYNYNGE